MTPPAPVPPPRKGLGGLAIMAIVVGAIVVFVVVIGLPAVSLLSSLGHSPESPKRTICAANLNAIGKGVAVYQADNDDASPPDLERLITDGLLDEWALVCPSGAIGRDCDYFYLPAAADASTRTFLACDLKGNHGDDGRNVLYVDLSVRFVPEADFQAELALPHNAAFAAALKKAEGP